MIHKGGFGRVVCGGVTVARLTNWTLTETIEMEEQKVFEHKGKLRMPDSYDWQVDVERMVEITNMTQLAGALNNSLEGTAFTIILYAGSSSSPTDNRVFESPSAAMTEHKHNQPRGGVSQNVTFMPLDSVATGTYSAYLNKTF